MIGTQRRKTTPDEEAPNFWVAYSDLMAGILMVFALLLIVAMIHYASFIRVKQEVLEAQEQKLKAFHTLEQKLIEKLETASFDDTVKVNPDTGVLQIESGVLFGEGEHLLRREARSRLRNVFDTYIEVVLDESFAPFLKNIDIVGHTNTNGTYLFNLQLSQKRALSVMEELLGHAGDRRSRLETLVMASGRSFAEPILLENGKEDPVASRRIEIKFRLREDEMLRDIYADLEAAQ